MKWKATLLLATAIYTFLGLPVTAGFAAESAAEDEVTLPDLAETPAAGSPGSSDQAPVSSAGSLDQAPASSAGSSDRAAASATLLEKGVKAYEKKDFNRALDYFNEGLSLGGSTPEQRITLHKYKGFVLVGQNNPEAAVREFVEALKLDSGMSLDPRVHSPAIMSAFQRARGEYQAYLTRPDPVPPTIEYTPYRGKLPSGIGIEIWSRIRDNTAVARAELFFRNKGDLGFQSLPLQNEGNDMYTGTVPADSITGSAIEYYLMAQDAAGNLSYAGTVESPYRVAVAAGPDLKPWYKKWWVWGIVALAAGAGAGAGIAMGGGGGKGSQETTNVTVVISPP